MSDNAGQSAQFNWQDAFTAPTSSLPKFEDAVLAPTFEELGLTNLSAPRQIPKPPDVDQILRGEYTGWVPVIKAGETLEEAQSRADALAQKTENEVAPDTSLTQSEVTAPVSQHSKFVVETIEYGLLAQPDTPVVVSRDVSTAAQSAADILDVDASDVDQVETVLPDPFTQVVPTDNQRDAFTATFDTSAWEQDSNDEGAENFAHEHSQTAHATIVDDAQQSNQSLELAIMRDEIQDLRTRLDASQKLIEEMMHKLANIAELALRSKI